MFANSCTCTCNGSVGHVFYVAAFNLLVFDRLIFSKNFSGTWLSSLLDPLRLAGAIYRSGDKYELILTTVARRDLDLNPDSHGWKPSDFTTQLSRYCQLARSSKASLHTSIDARTWCELPNRPQLTKYTCRVSGPLRMTRNLPLDSGTGVAQSLVLNIVLS